MDHNRRSRLLWHDLKFFRQLNVDARRIEQLKQFCLVFEVRACGIAKTESRTLVTLTKQLIKVRHVSISDAQYPFIYGNITIYSAVSWKARVMDGNL